MFGGTDRRVVVQAKAHPPPPRRPRRADPAGALAAQHRRHVKVAPVESVRRAEGRNDAEIVHPVQLLLAWRAGRAPSPAGGRCAPGRPWRPPRARPPRSSVRWRRRRSRAQAVARRAQKQSATIRYTSSFENRRRAGVGRRLACGGDQVRLGQPGALRLRRAVEDDLQARRCARPPRSPAGRARPRPASAARAGRADRRRRRSAASRRRPRRATSAGRRRRSRRHRGGDPEAGVVLAGPPDQVRVVVLGDRREERQPDVRPGGVPQQPRRLEGAGPTDDPRPRARRRIGRGRGDARLVQRHAVADRHLARGVDRPDRKLGGHAIQVFLGRVAPLLEHRVVVADAQDVLVLGGEPARAARSAAR